MSYADNILNHRRRVLAALETVSPWIELLQHEPDVWVDSRTGNTVVQFYAHVEGEFDDLVDLDEVRTGSKSIEVSETFPLHASEGLSVRVTICVSATYPDEYRDLLRGMGKLSEQVSRFEALTC